MAEEGLTALAADLYDGEVAYSADEVRRLRRAVKSRRARATLVRWIHRLRDRPDCNGGVGTVGWCYGGGWRALSVSMASPVAATVVYYGRCDITPRQVIRRAGPVKGHFETGDRWTDRAMVTKFGRSMPASGKECEIHWYKAGHAPANPDRPVNPRKDAEIAWSRTVGFFRRRLTWEPLMAPDIRGRLERGAPHGYSGGREEVSGREGGRHSGTTEPDGAVHGRYSRTVSETR